MQSRLTCHEKAMLTCEMLRKRKAEKEKGEKAAIDHLYTNSLKIQKCLKHRRKVGHKEW